MIIQLPLGKYYLSGPMSGYEDLNYPMFHRIDDILTAAGYTIINPAKRNPGAGSEDWEFCLKYDIDLVFTEPDLLGTIFMGGIWHPSTGARLESFTTHKRGLILAEYHEPGVNNEQFKFTKTKYYMEDGDFGIWCDLVKET